MFVEFDIGRGGFSVRAATAADAKAVRMLLPVLSDAAQQLVAVDGQKQVVGAAAVTRTSRLQPLAGPGISIHVIEPCRRQRVGKTLLEHIERAATSAGAKALYGAMRVDRGSDGFRGWERLGFMPCETVEEHVLPIAQIEARLGPLVDRMRRQGRIPSNARVVPLYEADHAAVLQLHLDNMGGDRAELARKLRGGAPGTYLPRQSRVLLIDNQVKGCLLASRVEKESISVEANIVDPTLRGGWANAWLKLEAFRGAPDGVKEFRFTSFDHYVDTRNFTKKLGGTTLRNSVLMMRPLARADNVLQE